jgi:hypothetical protein
MNQSALRLFVRSIISEAKEVKDTKKAEKKDTKLPKSSGKLMDLKKELAALEQYRDEIQLAKFAEKTAETEVEFADLYKFKKELDAIKEKGIKLESDLEAKIEEIKARIGAEKGKIKEMIGLAEPKTGMGEEKVKEARFKKGTDIGKPGKGFEKIAKSAAKQYGSKEAGKKVAGAILKKVVAKEKK